MLHSAYDPIIASTPLAVSFQPLLLRLKSNLPKMPDVTIMWQKRWGDPVNAEGASVTYTMSAYKEFVRHKKKKPTLSVPVAYCTALSFLLTMLFT